MRVIAKSVLREFWELHPDSEQALRAWYRVAREATWRTPAQVKASLPWASVLPESRVVFNISGNKYRLVVRVRYEVGLIYIRFIGTHSEYDEIDARVV